MQENIQNVQNETKNIETYRKAPVCSKTARSAETAQLESCSCPPGLRIQYTRTPNETGNNTIKYYCSK